MASKRALQLFSTRSQTSVIGRHTSRRFTVNTTRTCSTIALSENISISPRRRTAAPSYITSTLQAAIPLQKRFLSRSAPSPRENKLYEFNDILHILEHPSDSRLLIDVREPHEYAANSIPTALNIPVTSHPDALLLSEEEFHDQFGFEKPPTGKEVVFFCKAGVRSRAAAGIARQAGYTNVGEYPGSWLDWQKRGGPGTKTPPKPDGVGEPTKPVTETKPTATTGTSGEEDLGPDGKPDYPPGGLMGTKQ